MANELKGRISLDVSGFLSALQTAGAKLKEFATASAKSISLSVNDDTSKPITEAGKRLKEATSEAEKLEDALKGAAQESTKIEPPKGVLSGLTDQFKSARDQANAGGGIFGSIASSIGQLVSPIGAATAAVGLLTAGIGASFNIGMEFETNLKSVQAVTGVAGAALDDIGNRARNLATTFGGSASEQLGVFQVTLSKIGPQLAQDAGALTTFAENVNVLSKTDSALGAAGAVDALTGAMLQFGVDVNNSNEVAKESTRFINVLAASAAVGSASVSDVAAAVAVVGGTAKNANVSFEETNAALQVLASKSLVGSQAGTALTAVVNKLQKAAGPAADQLIAMGTSSEELGQLLTTKGIGAAMDRLGESMKSLGSEAQKNAFLNDLFGETGLNAASALLKSGDMLKDFTTKVTGTGDAFEQAQINMSTLSERFSRAMASLEDVGITVYQAILPVINQVLDFFDKLFQSIAPVLTKIKTQIGDAFANIYAVIKPILTAIVAFMAGSVIQSITIAIGVFSAFASYLGTFTKRIREAIEPVFSKIASLFGSAGDSAISFESIIKGVGKAIEIFAGILSELGGFIAEVLVVPFQLLLGAIGNIIDFFKSFTSSAQTTKSELKGTGEQAQKAASLFEILGNAIQKIPAFLAGLRGAFVAIKEVIFEFAEAISNTFNKGIGATFDKIYNIFAAAGSKTGKAFEDEWNKTLKSGDEKRKEVAEESGKAVGNALGAGVVQGYEYWQEKLKKLTEDVAKGTAEEDKAAVKTYIDSLQAAALLATNNISDKQQEELRDKAAKLIEKEKKDNKDKNKELLDGLKKSYELEKAKNDEALAAYELKIDNQVLLEKREKRNEEESRLAAERKLETAEKNLAIYERIFKVALDASGVPLVTIPSLEDEGKNQVKKEYLAFLKDLSSQRIQLNKVDFNADSIKAQLDKIISSIDISKGISQDVNLDLFSNPIEIDAAFNVKTGEALSKSDLFFLNAENKVKELNEFILKSEERLQLSKDDVEKKALKTQIDRAKEEVKKSEKGISDERLRVQEAEQLLRQTIIGDLAEKEYVEKTCSITERVCRSYKQDQSRRYAASDYSTRVLRP